MNSNYYFTGMFELNWRGLITLFGLLGIVKGVVRIGFPDWAKANASKILSKAGTYWGLLTLMLALGIYFIYVGYQF